MEAGGGPAGTTEMDGVMTSAWLRTFLLQLVGTAIGFVMAWPYIVQLASAAKEALNRTTVQERERAAALRELHERCATRRALLAASSALWELDVR